MFRLRNLLQWLVPVALGLGAIAYSVYRRSETQYWDGAVGNWVATLLGIVTGVPVALFLERKRTSVENQSRQDMQLRLRQDVLALLRDELADAKAKIAVRASSNDSLPIEPLKVSNREAMKSSGNLRHVSEPNLLGAISNAYRLLHCLADAEKSCLGAINGINVDFSFRATASERLLQHVLLFRESAAVAVENALRVIRNSTPLSAKSE